MLLLSLYLRERCFVGFFFPESPLWPVTAARLRFLACSLKSFGVGSQAAVGLRVRLTPQAVFGFCPCSSVWPVFWGSGALLGSLLIALQGQQDGGEVPRPCGAYGFFRL